MREEYRMMVVYNTLRACHSHSWESHLKWILASVFSSELVVSRHTNPCLSAYHPGAHILGRITLCTAMRWLRTQFWIQLFLKLSEGATHGMLLAPAPPCVVGVFSCAFV